MGLLPDYKCNLKDGNAKRFIGREKSPSHCVWSLFRRLQVMRGCMTQLSLFTENNILVLGKLSNSTTGIKVLIKTSSLSVSLLFH